MISFGAKWQCCLTHHWMKKAHRRVQGHIHHFFLRETIKPSYENVSSVWLISEPYAFGFESTNLPIKFKVPLLFVPLSPATTPYKINGSTRRSIFRQIHYPSYYRFPMYWSGTPNLILLVFTQCTTSWGNHILTSDKSIIFHFVTK